MLSNTNILDIRQRVQAFWKEKAQDRHFIEMAKGKEIGHRIADYVDEKTTSFLHAHYSAAFERDKSGSKKPRSMGDVWIEENNFYHPVNIKTGVSGTNGQPNMVAMRKLLKCLLQRQIDSYYLLMVKFADGLPTVYFLDMLDYIEFLSFDSGPGQIMLRAQDFFEQFESHNIATRNLLTKAEYLMEMLKEGDERLQANRDAKRGELVEMMEQYRAHGDFDVSFDNQREFNLIP